MNPKETFRNITDHFKEARRMEVRNDRYEWNQKYHQEGKNDLEYLIGSGFIEKGKAAISCLFAAGAGVGALRLIIEGAEKGDLREVAIGAGAFLISGAWLKIGERANREANVIGEIAINAPSHKENNPDSK